MSGTTDSFTRALVPFSFKRGQCFLCHAPAVRRIADEPVCVKHKALIEAIRRDAAQKETAR